MWFYSHYQMRSIPECESIPAFWVDSCALGSKYFGISCICAVKLYVNLQSLSNEVDSRDEGRSRNEVDSSVDLCIVARCGRRWLPPRGYSMSRRIVWKSQSEVMRACMKTQEYPNISISLSLPGDRNDHSTDDWVQLPVSSCAIRATSTIDIHVVGRY